MLRTGIEELDKSLMGGLEIGSIIEFYGKASGGKTQWCYHLAVRSQLSLEEGGLECSVLDKLTITAIKVKAGYGQRATVPHDIKQRFPRISTNELQECRQTAVGLYESYLALKDKKGWNASRPTATSATRRIPR
ncbi:MAG: hypothetical protein ACTSPB_19185, partial [Candidatus Thorarchaeota archaeon]